ncbi:hypothetical protein EYF80_049242 [Liparis tanakae]|uniref:Uncharacterized protein n=1 Tax=Liparis tanakae TaxID=230148 RepID=A0A4Z2FII2_9TELE|nr:hypothetical protein EYF80_049242 [Liparis tanakae]
MTVDDTAALKSKNMSDIQSIPIGANTCRVKYWEHYIWQILNTVQMVQTSGIRPLVLPAALISAGSEEEVGGNSRQRHNRHARDEGAAAPGTLEKRMEELEKKSSSVSSKRRPSRAQIPSHAVPAPHSALPRCHRGNSTRN